MFNLYYIYIFNQDTVGSIDAAMAAPSPTAVAQFEELDPEPPLVKLVEADGKLIIYMATC